jgi:hypothetical protein
MILEWIFYPILEDHRSADQTIHMDLRLGCPRGRFSARVMV